MIARIFRLGTLGALALAAAAWSGCAASRPETPAPNHLAADPLAAWLEAAERPSPVVCSVKAADAPEAVARFEAISARVAALYGAVYEAAAEAGPLPGAAHAGETQGEWKAAAQAAVTARYQATMAEIAAVRRELDAYTETLRVDDSISNITESLRHTRILTAFGNDSTRLDAQLRAAERGAALMLREGLAATSAR